MTIDPRLKDRRREVAEHNAQRNVGRLLRFLMAGVAIAAAVWLVFSPWMSISRVEITGILQSGANSVLADHRVVAGTPMIQMRPSTVEHALLSDAWIASADVTLDWPNRVVVEIEERSPLVWTQTADGWTRRAVDGVALPSEPTPTDDMGQILMPGLTTPEADESMLGALAFYSALDTRLHPGSQVYLHEGELWATVAGYQVRLGRGVEMPQKALSLAALIAEGLDRNAVVILIAPTHPAVQTPGIPASDGEETDADNP